MGKGIRRDDITRRQFVQLAAAMGLGTALASCGEDTSVPAPPATESLPAGGAASVPSPLATESLPAGGVASVPSPLATKGLPTTGAPTAAPPAAAAPSATAVPPAAAAPLASPAAQQTATLPSQEPPTPAATARQETPPPTSDQAYLAVARGSDPKAITLAALAAIGGIERFVKSGADVVLKPNICVDYRTYEYGATTNPEVLAALVELCLAAGARRVRVMDSPFGGTAKTAYARSGIADAVKAAGGEMEVMNQAKFVKTAIPEGRDISSWKMYQEVLAADVLINVPVAKHHSLARLSLGGKNLMGVILDRNMIHANLGQRIADVVSVVRPTLTVVDAVRTLLAHGPTGGNLDDVRLSNTVIASHDIVAADAYAATLFGLAGKDISYVKAAAEMGLGTLDLGSIKVQEIAVG
jgi:uncharacterized protein (DUF362 family)